MHMSDALLSPAVGAASWVVAAGLVAHAARRVEPERAPLMGVLGAFVFAAQMVNFSIPGTGSSGHLGGGLLLSMLLGPQAALLVLVSVLTVQALLFADGGLLALGCNAINLGLFTCFVGYPLLRLLAGGAPTRPRLVAATVLAAVVGLALGACGVVLETSASGISALPAQSFLSFMLPIHVAIGVVEGLVTAAVVLTLQRARPDLATLPAPGRGLLTGLLGATLLVAGLSWLASSRPDGLEWSVLRVAGPDGLARLGATKSPAGTSLSGLVGVLVTLLLALGVGVGLRHLRSRPQRES